LAGVSAVVLWLSCPPWGLAWLQWVAAVPVLLAAAWSRPLRAAWLGAIYGVSVQLLVFCWVPGTLRDFHGLAPAAAAGPWLVMGALGAPTGALVVGSVPWLRDRLGAAWVCAVPALLVLCEVSTAHLAVIPYAQGLPQYQVADLVQVVSVTGASGLTFLVWLVSAGIAHAWLAAGTQRARWRPLTLVLVLLAAVCGWGHGRRTALEAQLGEAPVLRWGQLQSAAPKGTDAAERRRDGSDWAARTRAAAELGAELVVWPETAAAVPMPESWQRLVPPAGVSLLAGLSVRDPVGPPWSDWRNAVVQLDHAGRRLGWYDKRYAMPFTESLPGRDALPWPEAVRSGVRELRPGRGAETFHIGPFRAVAAICYEVVLPWALTELPPADLLVNVTNDAWLGRGPGPHLHGMVAAVRAVELGLPVIRAAYTGISFVAEPTGALRGMTRPFEAVTRVVPVRVATVDTGYRRHPLAFPALMALLLAGLLLTPRRR